MRSILKYIQKEKCIFEYNKEEILNEAEPLTTLFLTYLLVSSLFYITIRLLAFILGSLTFDKIIKKKEELPDYSKKLSEILNDNEIICYKIKDNTPNAFNAGQKYCYMTDKLYDMLTEKERIAIFLHEYGHYKNNHHIKIVGFETTFGVLTSATINVILYFTLGVIIPPIAFIVSLFVSSYLGRRISRAQEHEADEFAAQYGYQQDLIGGLKKIEDWVKLKICKDLKKEDCNQALQVLSENSTHPSFKERFVKILKTKTMQRFIYVMSIRSDDTDLYTIIKRYIKTKWTDLFGKSEVP